MPSDDIAAIRSRIMAKIKGKDTKPEEIVRKYLFARGFRYRKNDKRYPGKPDIVLPKYKTAIFVNGCFWHMHEDCKEFRMPKSNISYWQPKLIRNRERDAENTRALQELGWSVLVVWECELKKTIREARLQRLCAEITGCENGGATYGEDVVSLGKVAEESAVYVTHNQEN